MIEHLTGSMFDHQVEAYVNPVNCVGVLGKGLALEFKKRFPTPCAMYVNACEAGEVAPGSVLATAARARLMIFHFPTKRHWRDGSRLEDIERGLVSLIEEVRSFEITSIAIPALGCGLGGLTWSAGCSGDVRPRIEAAFAPLTDVRCLLFAPGSK